MRICDTCGAKEFTKIDDRHEKCDYCGNIYESDFVINGINPLHQEEKVEYSETEKRIFNGMLIAFFSIIVFAILVIFPPLGVTVAVLWFISKKLKG